MANYVNEKKFFDWYNSVSKVKSNNMPQLLDSVRTYYCDTGSEEFTVKAEKSVTGQDESYKFRYENLGCCGASTIFIYF